MVRFANMASLTSGDKGGQSLSSSAGAGQADWQSVLAQSVRDPAELCRLSGLSSSLAEEAAAAAADLSVLVPRTYLARIRPGDPHDPLLAQVLPRAAEQVEAFGFCRDPLGEASALVGPGLLCRYPGRSLIVTTPECSVHCRFCFRRHFPRQLMSGGLSQFSRGENGSVPLPNAGRKATIRRIAADASIREVILSGGDPLTLPDEKLDELARRLAEIPHLRRLRIHTRLPIMVPQRVTDALLGCLRGTRLTPMVVVHVNHPAEIDLPVAAALGRLIDAGIPVLQQGVLLRGVNDQPGMLLALYQRLIDLRVVPYYLHQLDRVAGAAHFEVPLQAGIRLVGHLRSRLPGYAVPRYVRENPAGAGKELLA